MKTKSKLEILGSLIALAALAIVLIGSYAPRANAGQYDGFLPVRTGTASGATITLPPLGSNAAYTVLSGSTTTAGVVQTTGSGFAVNPALLLTSTAAIAAVTGTVYTQGMMALSSSGYVITYTGTSWVH